MQEVLPWRLRRAGACPFPFPGRQEEGAGRKQRLAAAPCLRAAQPACPGSPKPATLRRVVPRAWGSGPEMSPVLCFAMLRDLWASHACAYLFTAQECWAPTLCRSQCPGSWLPKQTHLDREHLCRPRQSRAEGSLTLLGAGCANEPPSFCGVPVPVLHRMLRGLQKEEQGHPWS